MRKRKPQAIVKDDKEKKQITKMLPVGVGKWQTNHIRNSNNAHMKNVWYSNC